MRGRRVGLEVPVNGISAASILVVDDDSRIRCGLEYLLRQEGYRVTAVANGQEALASLRSQTPPDLILLDLMMPVMDGFEFRIRQLQEPGPAAIPVIVLSAGADVQRKPETLHVAACVSKPIDPDALLALVACCLGARADWRARRTAGIAARLAS